MTLDIYIVKSGDTLDSISEMYGVSASRLAYDNDIENGRIVVGQALIVLKPDITYVLRDGDTLYSIAEDYNITVNDLLRNNSFLLNENFLLPGRELVITYMNDGNAMIESGNAGMDEGADVNTNIDNINDETGVSTGIDNIDISGYAYAFIDENTLEEACLYIDELLPFSYGFNYDGSLIPMNDDGLIDTAERFGNSIRMVITPLDRNERFNNQLVVALLSDEVVQDVLLDNMVATMTYKGYTALDIDFEFIPGQYRQQYVAFVNKVRERLNANGYKVSVALPPKISDDQQGLLYEGIDYEGLGNAANTVFLMTYEWGYKYGPPMAVAPIPSVRRVLDYAVTVIPREKIYMGIPNYAYDWPLPYERGNTVAETIGNTEAVRRAYYYGTEILYDEQSKSPYYYYTDNGIEHVVWFEDVRSISEKYKLVFEYGFRGAGYWNLMREFRPNWMYVNYII